MQLLLSVVFFESVLLSNDWNSTSNSFSASEWKINLLRKRKNYDQCLRFLSIHVFKNFSSFILWQETYNTKFTDLVGVGQSIRSLLWWIWDMERSSEVAYWIRSMISRLDCFPYPASSLLRSFYCLGRSKETLLSRGNLSIQFFLILSFNILGMQRTFVYTTETNT